MISILHINGNYVGTALHQTMIEHLDSYTKNQVFAPIYPITEDQLSIKPNKNVIISQCYKKRDRYFFSYKQHKILKSLEEHLSVSDYNIVHAYTLFTDGNCAYNIKKKYGIPYIVAVRDSDVNAFFKKAPHLRSRGEAIMRESERIIFLSDSYKNTVLSNYVSKRHLKEINKKSIVIPNGINDLWFDNLYLDRDVNKAISRFSKKELRIITIGVITPRKNTLKTIEAIDILKSRGWNIEFTVIGQPIDKDLLEKITQHQYVHYYDKMPMSDLISYYRSNDIFVMPSITETFGLTYVEALTQQLPVIYSKGQGFDKQFDDGYVGYPVDCNSAVDIANNIENICNRYDVLVNNTIDSSRKYKWESIISMYLNIYESIYRK